MSNIRKSVMNIHHIKHTRSANTARLIINDKHPPLIISFYYKYNNFFLNIQIFCNIFCAISVFYNSSLFAVDSDFTIFIAAVCYHSCCQCDNKNDRHKFHEIFHKHYFFRKEGRMLSSRCNASHIS